MRTGARARKQKYISIYISLYMKTFLKTGVYIYIYTRFQKGFHIERYIENGCVYIYIYTPVFKKVFVWRDI